VALTAIMPASFDKARMPDDLATVIAYLRSVKPFRNEVRNPSIGFRSPASPITTRRPASPKA
jgi:hypothetical protein